METRIKPEPLDDAHSSRVLQDRNTERTPSKVNVKQEQLPVKPEPIDDAPWPVNASPARHPKAENTSTPSRAVKKEAEPTYEKYGSVDEIQYTPEAAFTAGTAMVNLIKNKIRTLDIGSKLRKEVWKKELEDLSSQTTPSTLIAICGATGAGKSSVINAVLDDSIVPTSGMRACTAVVTEISYKPGRSIEGEVSFLSREEWRAELEGLIDDLTDNDGAQTRAADLRGDAAIAWSKVHAVYPNLPQDMLIRMTPDDIINRDAAVARNLGTVKKISAANSREFGKAIGEYIDSKEKKRGKKDDEKKSKSDGPAWWPLIRTVKVKCPARALETGAVLVDLPGTADSNAARSSIAQQYMQRCQCIWILAPITRAVDDKVAKDLLGQAFKTQLLMDGNYDASTVTFIATKTDDLSCIEIINALHLRDDDDLNAIEDKIDAAKQEEKEQKKIKADADNEAKELGQQFKDKRAIVLEYKAWIRALKNGEEFIPRLLGKKEKGKKGKEGKVSAGKKRKSTGRGSPKKTKRRKSDLGSDDDDSDLDDFIVDDLLDSDNDNDSLLSSEDEKDNYKGSDSDRDDDDDDDAGSSKGKDYDDAIDVDALDDEEMEEEVTVESLKEKLKPVEDESRQLKEALDKKKDEARAAYKRATKAKDKIAQTQREKNAFCSKARNEYSRDALKEDWRTGIKEMDQEAAQQRDPANFDPTQNMRDYSAIDLPTFTVSSRDYIRITKQVDGDGGPTCFTDREDTQIPQLQDWCHSLTVASRERSARAFLTQLKTFAAAVQSYVHDMNTVSEADRTALRERWATEKEGAKAMPPQPEVVYNPFGMVYSDDEDDPYYMAKEATPFGNDDGVTPTLIRDFDTVVQQVTEDLKEVFRQGLEEKLTIGSTKAANAAVETSELFASQMHWATYRATLKRDGVFRRDLNAELSLPMTASIAQSWAQVFEQNLFADFEKQAMDVVLELIEEIKEEAAPGLRERTKTQGELAIEDTKTTMKKMIDVISEALQKEQKEVSRSLSPHVQAQMRDGYMVAMEERGRGSVARQKAKMHEYVREVRHELFDGASQVIMDRLSQAAETVGQALKTSLHELACKVEVDMSVLWENVKTDPKQTAVRHQAVVVIQELVQQLDFWMAAERNSRSQQVFSVAT